MDGPEEKRRAADEIRRVPKLEHGEALLEIEAGLSDAQGVVEGQHLFFSKPIRIYHHVGMVRNGKGKTKHKKQLAFKVVNLARAWRRR